MIILPNITQVLEENVDYYRTMSDNYKSHIDSLVCTTIQGLNKHKVLKRWKHLGCCSLSSKELNEKFVEYGKTYKDVIPHFFDIVDEDYDKYNSNKKKRHTKYYRLKDSIVDCLITDLKTNKTILKDSKTKKNIHYLRENGIRKTYTDKRGVTSQCKSEIQIDTWVKGNEELIDKYIDDLEGMRYSVNDIKKSRCDTLLIELCCLKSLMNNNLKKGFIPQIYQESNCGRLTGKGFHLLNMSKKIRFIFFGDMNLYDYDISNCHYSIFSNLTRQYGYDCEGIEYYLNNKLQVRERLSEELGLSIKQIKTGLISLIYGNKLEVNPFNSLWDELHGEEGLRNFSKHKVIKKLVKEIKIGSELIINNMKWTRKNRYGEGVMNVVGKTRFIYDDKGRRINNSKLLSHELMGYERKLMEFISKITDKKMIGLFYDGWISEQVDSDYISNKIREEFNFNISIDSKLIVSPTSFELGL